MRLDGKVAVVTGAASGLGRAIALRFAREGAKVIVSDIREDPIWDEHSANPTAKVIADFGGHAEFVQTDVTDSIQVSALIDGVADKYGRIDIMVTSAAIFPEGGILDTSEEQWDAVMNVNVRAQYLLCKATLARMQTQKKINDIRGRIVNISSQHGMVGPPDFCAYAVSKSAIVQLTRQLAVDFGKKGIMVNSVAPGRIMTGTHEGEVEYITDGAVDDDIRYSLSRTPFYRLGRPDDVAGAALFLASDDCTYVSGHNLLVDGGWMAY